MKKIAVFLLILSVIAGFCACPDPGAANPANGGSTENGNTPDTGNSASPAAKPYQRIDADGTPNENGDYILFGEYPQTKVTDSSIIDALGDYDPDTWKSYGYYINKNVSDFMKYTDKEYEGAKYRGVYFIKYRPYYCENDGSADKSFQDENGYTVNTVYWFKYEPIKWRILSKTGKEAFLLSETAIDSQQWDFKGGENFSNNYAESTIRAWLNETFYNTAFNSLQQPLIRTTTVDNSAASTGFDTNPNACDNTNDRIFLLSYAEATDADYGLGTEEARIKKCTEYAQSQGCWKDGNSGDRNGNCSWWFRSPANDESGINARLVNNTEGKSIIANTAVYQTWFCVLPALTISL